MLLNNIFAELDGSSKIKNIISYTDRLNLGLGRLQLGRWYIGKYYGRKYKEIIPMR